MRLFIFLLALTICSKSFSQVTDSTTTPEESAYADSVVTATVGDDVAPVDTLEVKSRSFDQHTVTTLKEDPELSYEEAPTVAENLWDRLKKWLAQFFDAFFDKATNTNWGKVLLYVAVMAAIVVIIMMILKVNAFNILARGEGAETFKHNILDENIHAMDFDKLIQNALSRGDHRLAVRLVFLYALKMLADKNLIHWHQGKTNHDYLNELSVDELKGGFNELNYYFEYAWYGNFIVSAGMFTHVQEVFNNWKRKL